MKTISPLDRIKLTMHLLPDAPVMVVFMAVGDPGKLTYTCKTRTSACATATNGNGFACEFCLN